MLLAFLGEAFDNVAVEIAGGALVALALLEYFHVGETIGPGQERLRRVVLGQFAEQRDAGFLQDVAGVFFMRQKSEDVPEQLLLVAGEIAHQLLGLLAAGFLHACPSTAPAKPASNVSICPCPIVPYVSRRG